MATSQGCHTKHSRYINNGWAFSSQTFCSLVQTHANTKANSHVGMWMNGFINSWLDSFCFGNKNNTVPITLIFSFFFHYTGGETPQNRVYLFKKLCIYSYTFKVQSPSKYSPRDAYTYWHVFSTAQSSFWTCGFWCLLELLRFFVSPLPHQQNISFWGLFSPRETKKKSFWVRSDK